MSALLLFLLVNIIRNKDRTYLMHHRAVEEFEEINLRPSHRALITFAPPAHHPVIEIVVEATEVWKPGCHASLHEPVTEDDGVRFPWLPSHTHSIRRVAARTATASEAAGEDVVQVVVVDSVDWEGSWLGGKYRKEGGATCYEYLQLSYH